MCRCMRMFRSLKSERRHVRSPFREVRGMCRLSCSLPFIRLAVLHYLWAFQSIWIAYLAADL